MAAQDNQIITLKELKSYLNWSDGDTAYDDVFNDMISSVSTFLEEHCNTKIKKCEVTEIISGQDSQRLFLSNRPVIKLISLKQFDGENYSDYMSSEDMNRYIIPLDHALYCRTAKFKGGIFNFQVEYSCGYDPVPQDLKLVCKELCAVFFRNSPLSEGRVGLISNQQGNFKMFFLDELPYHKKVIDKYRLINV